MATVTVEMRDRTFIYEVRQGGDHLQGSDSPKYTSESACVGDAILQLVKAIDATNGGESYRIRQYLLDMLEAPMSP